MGNYSERIIEQVWTILPEIKGYDPSIWKKDFAGAWINRNAYGMKGNFGWAINLLKPAIYGGSNNLNNLKPLHWKNIEMKSFDYPLFKTAISSYGNTNVERIQKWRAK